jgi:class I fructose-bisphosphate aldolase
VGRNVFQHENPTRLVQALNMIVHGDESVETALNHLNA